jgi:2-oxoglutarate dehydrogenase E1 component
MSPKRLLRFKDACSDIEEFKEGLRFMRIIPDQNPYKVSNDKIKRAIFCSGQVYYDLEAARVKENIQDITITRVE